MRRGHTDLEHDFLQPSLTIEDAESESESDESYYPELGSEPDTEDEEVGVIVASNPGFPFRILSCSFGTEILGLSLGVMGSCVDWFCSTEIMFTTLCIVQMGFPAIRVLL